jgi:hypothetical protein
MALSRTWFTRGNVPLSDFTTTLRVAQSVLWALKEALKGTLAGGTNGPSGAQPAGAAWPVQGSSDSVGGAMDAVDRWTAAFDATKIVRGIPGAPHSWIVHKSPITMATGPFYICIDFSSAANDQRITIIASQNPFTGGTNLTRPTAVNEWIVQNDSQFVEALATGHKLHYTVDANGNFYFQLSKDTSGSFSWFLMGTTLADARVGDLHNFFTTQHFLAGGRGTPSATTFNTNLLGRTYNNGAQSTGGAIVYTGILDGTLAANQVDSKFDSLSIYVYSTNALAAGVRGRIPDLAAVGVATVGGSDPSTLAQERVVAGGFLIPNGVVPVL